MNRILVPVNLRSDFDNVLKYASSVGIRSGAEITLFYYGGRRLLKGSGEMLLDNTTDSEGFLKKVKGQRHRDNLSQVLGGLDAQGITYRIKTVKRNSYGEIIRECDQETYDMVIMGTHFTSGWGRYVGSTLANRIIGAVQVPVFVVPATRSFNEIQHITYAVDLSDYDPSIIQQVKTIARLFDAKLSITHVNVETEPQHNEQYRRTLEQTISDTLDYPKIYYKFFDHADPLGGIVKFVNMNNSNLVAMINRKKFSWRHIFSDKSLTRKIAAKVSVPILAFHK